MEKVTVIFGGEDSRFSENVAVSEVGTVSSTSFESENKEEVTFEGCIVVGVVVVVVGVAVVVEIFVGAAFVVVVVVVVSSGTNNSNEMISFKQLINPARISSP